MRQNMLLSWCTSHVLLLLFVLFALLPIASTAGEQTVSQITQLGRDCRMGHAQKLIKLFAITFFCRQKGKETPRCFSQCRSVHEMTRCACRGFIEWLAELLRAPVLAWGLTQREFYFHFNKALNDQQTCHKADGRAGTKGNVPSVSTKNRVRQHGLSPAFA